MRSLYRKNQLIRVYNTFTVDGVLTDPTEVTLTIDKPLSATVVYTYSLAEITRGSIGYYYKDIPGDEEGDWIYRFAGTGTVQAVFEDYFTVTTQIPANDLAYATVPDIQNAMPDTGWNRSYDDIIETLSIRASRLIDGMFDRKPGAFAAITNSTRYYDGSGESELWIDEIAAAPSLVAVSETGGIQASDYVAWAVTDYILWPYNALDEGIPYTKLLANTLTGTKFVFYQFPKSVKITAPFGFSVTPPPIIVEATVIQVARWFERGRQAFADAGAISELGQLRYVKQLDPDVENLLSVPKLQRLTV